MNGSTNPYQTPESEGSLPVEELGEPTPGAAAIILLAIVLGTLLNHSVVFWAGGFLGRWYSHLLLSIPFTLSLYLALIPVAIGLGFSAVRGQVIHFHSKSVVCLQLIGVVAGTGFIYSLPFMYWLPFDSFPFIMLLPFALTATQGVLLKRCLDRRAENATKIGGLASLAFFLGSAAGFFQFALYAMAL